MTIFSDSPAGMNIAMRRKHGTFSDLPEGMNTVLPKGENKESFEGKHFNFSYNSSWREGY